MTQDEIIEMARQAGIVFDDKALPFYAAFAKLVAAKRTEDIARHCMWLNDEACYTDGYDFANAIRVKFQDE